MSPRRFSSSNTVMFFPSFPGGTKKALRKQFFQRTMFSPWYHLNLSEEQPPVRPQRRCNGRTRIFLPTRLLQKICSQVYSLRCRSSVPPPRRLSVPARMQILLLFRAFHNVFIIPYCPTVVKGFFCKKSGQPLDKSKKIAYNRNRKSIPVDGLLPRSTI